MKQGLGVISGDYLWLSKNGLTVHNKEFEGACNVFGSSSSSYKWGLCRNLGVEYMLELLSMSKLLSCLLSITLKWKICVSRYDSCFVWLWSMSYSFIPLACAECADSLPFSGDSSIPLCYVLFPATLPTILPSSLTSSCHLFLGLLLSLVPKFIYNTLLGIIFSSFFCTCPNQHNLFSLIVSIIVGFLTLA